MNGFERGDAVIFVRRSHTMVIGQPTVEADDITVGVVTSVTRDGQIKAYRHASWGHDVKLHKGSLEHCAAKYLLPKASWDISGIEAYMPERPWSHAAEYKCCPFSSLDEAKAELAQFRVKVSA